MFGFDILEQTASTAKLTSNGKKSILSLEQPDNVMADVMEENNKFVTHNPSGDRVELAV
ncbi:hypothetical protein [Neobacillus sp. DY30]|uniref:hypothetical protein n=1 Tax=Neobacillus sp. DY30 TaxID=3047871 RepID=UPI0024C02AEF|nr:hypothetical protein [Neobacillus sp. DY30]WHX98689.1 hypothetical protein QNH29_19005 [Neobacillus sp. DY30]